MGDWRSRWERKRDLDNLDPEKDHITRIVTRGTDKDYKVQKVFGTSPDNLYFVAVPEPEKPKKKSGRYEKAVVYQCNYCAGKTKSQHKKCKNYVKRYKK